MPPPDANKASSDSRRRPVAWSRPAAWSPAWSTVRPGGSAGATSPARGSSTSRQSKHARSPASRPTVPPTANATSATSSSSTRPTARPTRSLLAEYYAVVREDKWRTRAQARAVELERPEWSRELGERPATVKGGRAWDRAVGQTVEYRQRWKVDDAERALGPEPHGKDASLEQRQARSHHRADRGRPRDHDLGHERAV